MEKNIKKDDTIKPSLLDITSSIKDVTGVDIIVTSRKNEIVLLKKIFYKIANEFVNASLTNLANFVKTKNHGTVLYHLKTVDDILEKQWEYQKIYEEVIISLTKKIGKKEFLTKNKQVVYKIQSEVKYVDYHNSGIPEYIIKHLKGYTEEQLELLYQTRIIPFDKMLKVQEESKKLMKKNIY